MGDQVEAARRQAFQQLQPVCSSLLLTRGDASAMSDGLDELLQRLQTISPAGLQACSDYVLFPLLFIADSVQICRSAKGGAPSCLSCCLTLSSNVVDMNGAVGAGISAAPLSVPAASSDRVAEQALACCRAVLEHSAVTHAARFHELLQRISAVAALHRSSATEEVNFFLKAHCWGMFL